MQRQETPSQSAYKKVKIELADWTTSVLFTNLVLICLLSISHHLRLDHIQAMIPRRLHSMLPPPLDHLHYLPFYRASHTEVFVFGQYGPM